MRWPVCRVAVVEQSMAPSVRPGDWLLAWRGLREGRPPHVRPGQLVIARLPADPEFLVIKRAVQLLPDGWWLESDNPVPGAIDSRSFGPISRGSIYARVLLRYRSARRQTAITEQKN